MNENGVISSGGGSRTSAGAAPGCGSHGAGRHGFKGGRAAAPVQGASWRCSPQNTWLSAMFGGDREQEAFRDQWRLFATVGARADHDREAFVMDDTQHRFDQIPALRLPALEEGRAEARVGGQAAQRAADHAQWIGSPLIDLDKKVLASNVRTFAASASNNSRLRPARSESQ